MITPGKCATYRKGFTLIELLVVVLILAILMAVALPLYLSSVADSQIKTCRANMQTIATAVEAARTKNTSLSDYSTFAGPVTIANEPDLQSVPICPTHGAYTIVKGGDSTNDPTPRVVPAGGFAVECANHGSFIPGTDSQ